MPLDGFDALLIHHLARELRSRPVPRGTFSPCSVMNHEGYVGAQFLVPFMKFGSLFKIHAHLTVYRTLSGEGLKECW